MAGELEPIVRAMFESLARKDLDALLAVAASDAQGIDEISRRWLRGREEMEGYLGGLLRMVDDVHSELNDVREEVYGDVGIVTFWLEQDYTLEGKRQHISAPTVALHREDGAWKTVLFHSIPLPEIRTA